MLAVGLSSIPPEGRAIAVVLGCVIVALAVGWLVGWVCSRRTAALVTLLTFAGLMGATWSVASVGLVDAKQSLVSLKRDAVAYGAKHPHASVGVCSETDVALATIRARESDTAGGYVAISKDKKAFGAYQFHDDVWKSLGGTGHASDAPPAEQDQRAAVYVQQIISAHGDVAAIPVQWFYPAALDDPSLLDFAPNPEFNGGQTIRQYQERWLAEYDVQSGKCTGQLVAIGQGGHQLNASAAAGFAAWQAAYGEAIPITDSYRSWALQAQRHAEEPDRFVAPEDSAHVTGDAVDVDMGAIDDARLIAAATQTGWCQAALNNNEPWHFSFNGCK